MTLRPFKMGCLLTVAVVPLIFVPCAGAGKDVVKGESNTLRVSTKEPSWFLRLPKNERITYRGVVSFDKAGADTGTMMYPAVDIVSFLAAVITHGVILDSVKKGKKSKLQEEADKVLSPYQDVLGNYPQKDLMQRGLAKVSAGGNKKLVELSEQPGPGWYIESAPVFSMTQDQSAIVLDNLILVYATDAPPPAPSYRSVVRVVSQAKSTADIVSFWTVDQGENLKEESANLFAESLDLVLNEVINGAIENSNPHKTVRYREGNVEKMERAQIVSESCNRKVIRTLRGWLMSVPVRRISVGSTSDQCADASGNSASMQGVAEK